MKVLNYNKNNDNFKNALIPVSSNDFFFGRTNGMKQTT